MFTLSPSPHYQSPLKQVSMEGAQILKSQSEIASRSVVSLCHPMDGILQARILKWVAISFSTGSSQARDRTWVSCILGRFFTIWATREAQIIILKEIQLYKRFSLVQSFMPVWFIANRWTTAHQASLSITNSQSLLNLMSIESVILSKCLILCSPLLFMFSIFPSIRVFSNESVFRIMWPKYRDFSFSISPFNEYLGLISFRMDWLDLLAVQGTLKSLLQHNHAEASIIWCLAFL